MAPYDIVIAMAIDGHPPRVIAAETGLAVGSVRAYLHRARRDGLPVPRFTAARVDGSVCLTLPDDVAVRLRAKARARRIGLPSMARAILIAVARPDDAGRDMIDAVLSDATDQQGGLQR